jgi:hypothetical protein
MEIFSTLINYIHSLYRVWIISSIPGINHEKIEVSEPFPQCYNNIMLLFREYSIKIHGERKKKYVTYSTIV